MALSTANVQDLDQYKQLSNHIVIILDKEATIPSELRQLTAANIVLLNTLYTSIVGKIQTIVSAA